MRLGFAGFVFDSRLRSITRDGEVVPLSPKAFQLLEALIEARPAPLPHEVLYDRLWPRTFVEAGNLHNLVAEIRRALADHDHQIVRTTRGVGYSFDARDAGMAPGSSRFFLSVGDEVLHLGSGENIVGRDPEGAVVIDSPGVSRQHARIFVSDDRVLIEDLGSKNGTYVGTERLLQPRLIGDGDSITLGAATLVLRKRGSVKSTETINS